MKKSLPFLFLILSASFTMAQTNTVFLEGGGNGILWSINYDRMIAEKISVRVGYGAITDETTDEIGLITETITVSPVPIIANYMLGSGNHKLEIGAGILYIMVDGNIDFGGIDLSASGSITATTGVLGYRYQRDTGGFFFRLALAPIMIEGESFVMPGLSLGYSF